MRRGEAVACATSDGRPLPRSHVPIAVRVAIRQDARFHLQAQARTRGRRTLRGGRVKLVRPHPVGRRWPERSSRGTARCGMRSPTAPPDSCASIQLRLMHRPCRKCLRRIPCCMCDDPSEYALCSTGVRAVLRTHHPQRARRRRAVSARRGSHRRQGLPEHLFDVWRGAHRRERRAHGAPRAVACIDPLEYVVEQVLTPDVHGAIARLWTLTRARCSPARAAASSVRLFCDPPARGAVGACACRELPGRPASMDDPYFIHVDEWRVFLDERAAYTVAGLLAQLRQRDRLTSFVLGCVWVCSSASAGTPGPRSVCCAASCRGRVLES